jgi:hypothetical protein
MHQERLTRRKCPVCGARIKEWYIFDDYGPCGGEQCSKDAAHSLEKKPR